MNVFHDSLKSSALKFLHEQNVRFLVKVSGDVLDRSVDLVESI